MSAKVATSGDPKMQTLFRTMHVDPTDDGVEVPRDGSALVRFSVVKAFAKIKAHTQANVEEARAKMMGGGGAYRAHGIPDVIRFTR